MAKYTVWTFVPCKFYSRIYFELLPYSFTECNPCAPASLVLALWNIIPRDPSGVLLLLFASVQKVPRLLFFRMGKKCVQK